MWLIGAQMMRGFAGSKGLFVWKCGVPGVFQKRRDLEEQKRTRPILGRVHRAQRQPI